MTVLVEGVSVIIKLEAIEKTIPDGFEGFRQYIPNYSWCKDDQIIRLGFLDGDEAKEFVKKLESLNLVYQGSEGAQDFAIVDQMYGPTSKCSWLECGHTQLNNDPEMKVAACRLAGTEGDTIVTPVGWEYQNSLTAVHGLTPPADDQA
jgi:hypothetical protein